MKKRDNIIYWISTIIFCLIFLFSAGMYILKYDMIAEAFTGFGYPTYLVYPLAIAKISGVGVILINRSDFLKYLAYAGFFYDTVLAFFAHYMIQDENEGMAVMCMLMIGVSFIYDRKRVKYKR